MWRTTVVRTISVIRPFVNRATGLCRECCVCVCVCACGSAKFGRKVTYVSYLHELATYLPLDQLIIPQRVQE